MHLVIGATGFVGWRLYKHLQAVYGVANVFGTSSTQEKLLALRSENIHWADLLRPWELKALIETLNPQTVWHCAAMTVPGAPESVWPEIVRTNVTGTLNVLSASVGRRVMYLSTINVYGPLINTVADENSVTNPTTVYAATKMAGEELVRAYDNMGKVDGKVFRLCGVVGGGMTHGVLHDFIANLKNQGNTLRILRNPPGTVKPYIYVGDLCKTLDFISQTSRKLVNITASNQISIDQVADITMEKLGIHKEKVWTGSSFSGDLPVVAVNSLYNTMPSSEIALSRALDEICGS